MLLKFFKSNLPYVVLFIPILGTILWLPSLFPELALKQIGTQNTTSPVFNWLTVYFRNNYYLSTISALILVILQSYLLIRLNFKYIFIETKTYLPAVIFVLFCSIPFVNQKLTAALLANLFFLFAVDRSFLITKERRLFRPYYESGIFLGIASLIYTPTIYYTLIIWLTLVVLRSFNWREWMSTVFGIFTPVLLYASISYLHDNFTNNLNAYMQLLVIPANGVKISSTISLVAFSIIAFILFIALLSNLRIIGTKKVNTRKYFNLFLWMLLLSAAIYFFLIIGGVESIPFMSIALSVIFSTFFIELKNKFFAEIIFTLLFLSIIAIIWF